MGCFVLFPTPAIKSVQPDSDPTIGETEITIIGAFFEAPVAITLNDVAATNVQLTHAQAITATTPPGDAGPATLALRFADGRAATLENAFTYVVPSKEPSPADMPLTITALTPTSGPAAGGTPLTVQGTGFVAKSVLLIGRKPALDFEFVSHRLITATTLPGEVGAAEVVLQAGHGRMATFPAGFTYLAPSDPTFPQPTVSAFFPASQPFSGGTKVSIQGSALEPGRAVFFGTSLALSTESVSADILRALTLPNPERPVAVVVELPDGRGVVPI